MINVADILKDMPYGTQLYSVIDGECYFNHVDKNGQIHLDVYTEDCIVSRILDKYGRLSSNEGCVVFPLKEIQDWSSYQHKEEHDKVISIDLVNNMLAVLTRHKEGYLTGADIVSEIKELNLPNEVYVNVLNLLTK